MARLTREWDLPKLLEVVSSHAGESTLNTHVPRYSREESARRGQELYEKKVLPCLKPDDDGKFVAIDIETGNYEINGDDYAATERLLDRHADAQIWMMRVGQRAAYSLGGQSITGIQTLS
jgi:hypothetical protein